jgi:hypothetical protein
MLNVYGARKLGRIGISNDIHLACEQIEWNIISPAEPYLSGKGYVYLGDNEVIILCWSTFPSQSVAD